MNLKKNSNVAIKCRKERRQEVSCIQTETDKDNETVDIQTDVRG